MMRTSLVSFVRPAAVSSRAAFSASARVMSDNAGSVGAPPKTGGQGDAFQKREKAAEDMAIRAREIEKLKILRQKLKDQEKNIKELTDHIDEVMNNSQKKQ